MSKRSADVGHVIPTEMLEIAKEKMIVCYILIDSTMHMRIQTKQQPSIYT